MQSTSWTTVSHHLTQGETANRSVAFVHVDIQCNNWIFDTTVNTVVGAALL